MEQSDMNEQSPIPPVGGDIVPTAGAPTAKHAATSVAPQACPGCGIASTTNGAITPSYVYAIGTINARFPNPSVENEIRQVMARGATRGLTDSQSLHKILSQPQNRYLVRQLCWVMTIQGLETYLLLPRDPADFSLLVDALRDEPKATDLNVVLGVRGPIASPEMCNGLMVPIVAFDIIYPFDREALIKSIPRPEKIPAKEFAVAAEELLDRIMQIADNAGATDRDRLMNYALVRLGDLYAKTAEAHSRNTSLSAVEVQPSPLSGTGKAMDLILTYTDRTTGVNEKYSARFDVQGLFPYLIKPLHPILTVE
jgi:hypothetical protein